jgi:hypothetical protein
MGRCGVIFYNTILVQTISMGESIQEDPGCGKRVEARTTENIKKVEVLVLAD